MPIFPTSWRIAPSRTISMSSGATAELFGDSNGKRREPLAVAVQIRVARLDRVRERARERGGEQTLTQLVAGARRALERVGDRGLKLGVRKRLRDETGRAARQRLAQRLVRAGAGDEHDRKRRVAAARRLEQLEAGEARHDDVADDEVELVVVEQVECMLGALGADDLVPDRLEDLDDEHADHVLVVDREDAAHWFASVASGSRTVKRAPRSELRRGDDRAAVRLGDPEAHGQSEAGAAEAALRGEERLEDAREQRGIDAGAVVCDRDERVRAEARDFDVDPFRRAASPGAHSRSG